MFDVTKDRNLYIGGSDIPIIMGISPFKTRFELLQEKAGIKEIEVVDNVYVDYGNSMEPIIRNFLNEKCGYNFLIDRRIKNNYRYHADGFDPDKKLLLEIKTTSQIFDNLENYKKYLVQLLLGIELFEVDNGLLAIYKRNEDFSLNFNENNLQLFYINKNDFLSEINKIYINTKNFLIDLQKIKENPFISEFELQPSETNKLIKEILNIDEELKNYEILINRQQKLKDELISNMKKNNLTKLKTDDDLSISLILGSEEKIVKKFDYEKFLNDNVNIDEKYFYDKKISGKKDYLKFARSKK